MVNKNKGDKQRRDQDQAEQGRDQDQVNQDQGQGQNPTGVTPADETFYSEITYTDDGNVDTGETGRRGKRDQDPGDLNRDQQEGEENR